MNKMLNCLRECISYLLLLNKLSIASVGQESGTGGCLWLRVSHRTAVKMATGAVLISKPKWDRVHVQAQSQDYQQVSTSSAGLLARNLISLPCGPRHRAC